MNRRLARVCAVVALSAVAGACGGDETGSSDATSGSTVATGASPSSASSGGAGGAGGVAATGSGGAGGNSAATLQSLLASVPDGAAWDAVPADVQKQLESRAEAYLAGVRERWGAAGLAEKESALLDAPTSAMTANVDTFVAYKFSNVVPAGFVASTDVASAELEKQLTRLALVYLAERRVFASLYDGLNEWDGTEMTEFLVWDAQALADQKAYAESIETALRALAGSSGLDAVDARIADKAISIARQLTRGVTVYSYGGDDWVHAATAADLVYEYAADYASFFGADDERFLEVLNAGTWVSLVSVNVGTAAKLARTAAIFEDPVVLDESGLPSKSPAGKGLTKLVSFWADRTVASAEAQKPCTVYTPAERAALWDGFTADQLQDNANATSLEGYAAGYGATVDERLAAVKTAAKSAVTATFPDATVLSDTEKIQVSAAIDAETRPAAILETVYAKLEQVTGSTAATDELEAAFDGLILIGGYASDETTVRPADEATMSAMWADVKDFLATRYAGKPVDIVALLPDALTVTTARASFTGPTGGISIGLAEPYAKSTLYRVMLHEAKHVVDVSSGQNVEGAQLEGAALAAELALLPSLLAQKLSGEAANLPLYDLLSEIDNTRITATTDATLKVLLRDSCPAGSPNTIEYAKDVVASYGYADDGFLTARAFRAHLNLQYLSYDYGLIVAVDALEYLSTQTGASIDPFLLQACGVFNLDKTPETVAKLKTCIGP